MTNIEKKLTAVGKRLEKRDGSLPVVERGTAAWDAWRTWRRKHGLSVTFMDDRDEWTVPMAWPDAGFEAELAKGLTGSLSESLQT